MKQNFLFFIILLSFLSNGVAQSQIQLNFNTKPAEIFLDIIEQKQLNAPNFSKTNYNNNIENLISLPIYKSLSENMVAYSENKEIKGKEAYRLIFNDFLLLHVKTRGGVNEQWKEWWSENNKISALQFLNRIKKDKKRISYEANNAVQSLLPQTLKTNQKVDVVFCFDGNRGSYTTYSTIVMDMLDFSDYNIHNFTNVLSHELHHIIYHNFIYNNYKCSSKTANKKRLFQYQIQIIKEGLAQQINFIDYDGHIKDLYFNKDLITELSDEWFSSFRKLEQTSQPEKYYDEFINYMWESAFDKLKKYYKGNIPDSAYGRRPTVTYYIGYYLYYSIYKNGKKEQLDYVISHPEDLLSIYNKLRNNTDLIPVIPKDIVYIWKNNLNKCKE